MLISGDIVLILKGVLPSVVTWLLYVSRLTSHSYNNLYPVKNRTAFQ